MKHRITVIVPVYNAEKYLEGCLESLAAQTIRKDKMEVLLVNDGSTDGSRAICERWCARHPWMRLINRPNGGPSAARNDGIRQAAGRYLMYLDADDTLSPGSVKAVRDFFAAHEDEVDIVTYPIVRHQNGRRWPVHYRYKYVNKTGIYDCNEKPFFAQGTINVCVRNFGEENILFEPDRFHHEDETYVTANMERRWKFGYTTDAEYLYNKDNDDSIMATSFHAFYIFEENTAWFERMFAAYPERVPLYLQGLLVNDIEWKLRGGLLFPWHYEGTASEEAMERLRALVRRLDARMIIQHPQMSQRQKIFWLNFAGNRNIEAHADNADCVRVSVPGGPDCVLTRTRRMAARIQNKRMEDGRFSCYGYLDTVYFTASPGTPKPLFFAEEDGALRQIPLFDSCESYITPRLRIGRMFGFHYQQKPDTLTTLRFFVFLKNQLMPLRLKYGGQHFLALHFKRFRHFSFWWSLLLKAKLRLERVPTSSLVVHAKKPKPPKRPIWLYYDPTPGQGSNAYLQFQHDFEKKDRVRRFFLLRNQEDAALFSPAQKKYLIPRHGKKHIRAYLRCEWILTSELALAAVSPFAHRRVERLAESLFLHYKIVYLQDGVHQFARQNWYYAERGLAEKIVISSPVEYDCFREIYGYRPGQLIQAGLARYDTLDREATAQKAIGAATAQKAIGAVVSEGRVLFAPSWRKYLMHGNEPARTRVRASDYYKNIFAFLNDPSLASLLETHKFELDVHLHPKFVALADLFAMDCPRIHILEEPPVLTCYNACITDIASIAYDFGYLGRYVQYFLPDGPQFRAGMHEHRAFDLPQRFGPHAQTPEEALAQLRKAALRKFAPEEEVLRQMQNFFYPLEDGREKVYRAVMG